MTPDEHYREAERLLKEDEEYGQLDAYSKNLVALAQVHATLATIYRSTERLKPQCICPRGMIGYVPGCPQHDPTAL